MIRGTEEAHQNSLLVPALVHFWWKSRGAMRSWAGCWHLPSLHSIPWSPSLRRACPSHTAISQAAHSKKGICLRPPAHLLPSILSLLIQISQQNQPPIQTAALSQHATPSLRHKSQPNCEYFILSHASLQIQSHFYLSLAS